MARALRAEYEGAFYHVTSRGNDRNRIFFNKTDYEKFKAYLEESINKFGYRLHAYRAVERETVERERSLII